MKKIVKKIVFVVTIVVALGIGAFLIYVSDYYKATEIVDASIETTNNSIETIDEYTVIVPSEGNNKQLGIIFYPGGKVEAKAYMNLLLQLADQGITSILVDMPFNLAVFNIDAAKKAQDLITQVDSWYLMGHSLGGAMASFYLEDNADGFDGLILLAAYPVNDSDIKTLQIVGSEDGVLDFTKLDDQNETYVIEGGNHAFFGDYGDQEGDNDASITKDQQQALSVQKILEFIQKKE